MNEAPPLIEVQRLCKTVRDATGELPILRDVSFALAQRQTAAIVGASGSGKSTLLSLIAGLDVPSSGTVRIAGQDLFAVDEDARAAIRARRLGFVFQNFQLVGGMTALDIVRLPLELAGAPRARAWPRAWGSTPSCFPAASSSALRWRAPSSCAPPPCWPMSRRAAWTSPPASA